MMRKLHSIAVAASLTILCQGCVVHGPAALGDQDVDDQYLLRYASRSYDKAKLMFAKIRIGVHHGTPIVAEFFCSDICPQYTVRIIHYEVSGEQSCPEVGGVQKDVLVPVGIGQVERSFCFPQIIVTNWRRYKM